MAHVNLELPAAAAPPKWFGTVTEQSLNQQLNGALNHKMHRERWKYTRVPPVLALLKEPGAPFETQLPEGVTLRHVAHDSMDTPAQVFFGEALAETLQHAPEATAWLCYQPNVQVLDVEAEVSEPLILKGAALHQPLIIRLAANASLDLHEIYDGNEGSSQLQSIWIDMQPGSRVQHSRNSFTTGTHWQYLRVNIGRDATYHLHNHSAGAELRRQDMQLICAAPGAHAEVTSAAFIGSKTHLDQQITVEHRAAHTTSEQTFHNIAAGGAKVTFNGRIHIHEHCASVDANLSNKNLSLGDNAVINTKPELEIYTDDVKCSHGATVGSLDQDHLFYCASRGIAPQQARTLLSQAFLQVCTLGPLAESAQQFLQQQAQSEVEGG